MRIIEIKAQLNGAHNNLTSDKIKKIYDGWAIIPDDMDIPNFPFGDIEVEEIDGVVTVTKWTAGVIPEPTPEPDPAPTEAEQLRADVDYIAIMTGVEL